MQDVYENIKEYNPGRKCNVLMVLHDMIADIISNKKLNQVVSELFIRGTKLSNKKLNQVVTELFTKRTKLNISTVFIK